MTRHDNMTWENFRRSDVFNQFSTAITSGNDMKSPEIFLFLMQKFFWFVGKERWSDFCCPFLIVETFHWTGMMVMLAGAEQWVPRLSPRRKCDQNSDGKFDTFVVTHRCLFFYWFIVPLEHSGNLIGPKFHLLCGKSACVCYLLEVSRTYPSLCILPKYVFWFKMCDVDRLLSWLIALGRCLITYGTADSPMRSSILISREWLMNKRRILNSTSLPWWGCKVLQDLTFECLFSYVT